MNDRFRIGLKRISKLNKAQSRRAARKAFKLDTLSEVEEGKELTEFAIRDQARQDREAREDLNAFYEYFEGPTREEKLIEFCVKYYSLNISAVAGQHISKVEAFKSAIGDFLLEQNQDSRY